MWHTRIRRPSDLGADESLRTESGRAAVGVVRATVVLAGLLFASPSATASDVGPGADVAFSGQVIERETGKPVGGAEILLERSIRGSSARTPPAWAGTSIIRTDAQGRFRVEFPAEQVAEPRLFIALRISHPEFISRKSSQVALTELIRGQARGEAPFFTTIALERGLEYTGQVVVPGGKPAAGIPYAFEHRTSRTSRPIPIITDDYDGPDGRRRPHPHADAENSTRWVFTWDRRATPGRDSPSLPISTSGVPITPSGNRMSGPRPTSAGSCWRGIRLSGRLLDSADRPVAGQTIIAYPLKGRDRHSTTTEADGTFALGPLRPANYLIYGEGQSPYFDWDLDAAAHARAIRVVRPARVYLKEGASPEPLVLREMPTVRVELRFVDSKRETDPREYRDARGSAPGRPAPARPRPPPRLPQEGRNDLGAECPRARRSLGAHRLARSGPARRRRTRCLLCAPGPEPVRACCYRPKTRQRPSSTGLTPMARSCRCRPRVWASSNATAS